MTAMDEYIDWLLSSSQDPTVQSIVRNILDEPIPQAVKKTAARVTASTTYCTSSQA